MAPLLRIPHGASGGATGVLRVHGRRITNLLAGIGLGGVAIVTSMAFHVVAALRIFFDGWATAPRPQPDILLPIVSGAVRVIDGFDRALRTASGLFARAFGAVEVPLRSAVVALIAKIDSLEDPA